MICQFFVHLTSYAASVLVIFHCFTNPFVPNLGAKKVVTGLITSDSKNCWGPLSPRIPQVSGILCHYGRHDCCAPRGQLTFESFMLWITMELFGVGMALIFFFLISYHHLEHILSRICNTQLFTPPTKSLWAVLWQPQIRPLRYDYFNRALSENPCI